ncbi:MAG: M28 family peptidase, partial [Lentisphaeria bacterium]|nr:M28 family peptidase [Lentisphaeria bacterium]
MTALVVAAGIGIWGMPAPKGLAGNPLLYRLVLTAMAAELLRGLWSRRRQGGRGLAALLGPTSAAWVLLAAAFMAVTVLVAARLGRPRPVNLVRTEIGAGTFERDLDAGRMRRDVGRFCATPSRLTGTAGARAAADAILGELAAMGALAVETQDFTLPVPVTRRGVLEVHTAAGVKSIPVHPLWPNLARTCQTPPEGLRGPLVDAGRGSEGELHGKQIRDALAVLDMSCNLEWLSIPEFGGRAVLFRAAPGTTANTARNKFLTVPADIPRYYIDAGHGADLDAALAAGAAEGVVHCDVSWERCSAVNILARITAGKGGVSADDPDAAPVVFHAYYDSISVVPDLAPGAEQACGAAALLELARVFAGTETDRPVYVLFTSGHGQALAGMLHFVAALRQAQAGGKGEAAPPLLAALGRPGLFVGLDLSTRSRQFGVFALGRFRGQYEHKLRPKFSILAAELAAYAASCAASSGDGAEGASENVLDCVNLTRGRHWWTYFPYQAPFESEVPVLAGIPGITFATVNDDRRHVDTPEDRPENLRFDLFEEQILAEPGARAGLATLARALTSWSGPFVSSELVDGWASLEGRVVWLDQERNYVPSEPLADALVFLKTQRGDKHLMGTRGIPAVLTDGTGRFVFDGLVQMTENWQFTNCLLEAYGPASDTFTGANPDAMAQYAKTIGRRGEGPRPEEGLPRDGDILYALDMARPSDYPWQIEIRKQRQHLNLVCFPCRSLTLTGLTDPRGYLPLKDLKILEAATLASPFQFGKSATDSLRGDDAEAMVTLWTDPSVRTMLTLGLGFEEKRLILVNNTPGAPEGKGFVIEDLSTVPSMVLQGAGDMWRLDSSRIAKLENNGVRNPRLSQYHAEAAGELTTAREALEAGDYRGYRIAAERAWALEGRAYTETLAMINNMIRGVLFYLALLLPFSYCLERLLLASGTIKRRMVWICTIFAVCFLTLAGVHPAFRFTLTPFLVLLAFIIVALVVTVSVLIVSRMDAVLQERKRVQGGRHDEQTNVGGIAVRAVDLGIANIRRRPQRGFLTGLTVVTVTFILLSFISLTPVVSISKLRHPEGEPTYTGLLIRDRGWNALPTPLHESIRRSLGGGTRDAAGLAGGGFVTAARAWFFSDWSGQLSQIDLAPVDADKGESGSSRSFTAVSLLCLEPTEPLVTGVDRALVAGRWFEADNERSIILPLHVAEQLGYGIGDIGRRVRVFGQELPIVGIVDEARLDAIRDMDGEPLSPVNFVLQQQLRAQEPSRNDEKPDTLEEYVHYASDQVAILPFLFGHRLGASIRSIAVRGESTERLDAEAQGYTKRSNLTVLLCDGKDVTLYAALSTSQLSAAWQIVVPVFLGFVMVLGTMLGSVYERRREIFVYNSVGLSPG